MNNLLLLDSAKDIDRIIEAFSETLAAYYPDLERMLQEALIFLEKVIQKSEGLIYTRHPHYHSSEMIVAHHLSDPLKQHISANSDRIWHSIDEAGFKVENLVSSIDGVGEVYIVPLICCSETFGYLLYTSLPDRDVVDKFLTNAARVLGRYIRMWCRCPSITDRFDGLNRYLRHILQSLNNQDNANSIQLGIARELLGAFHCQAVVIAFYDLDNQGVLFKKTLTEDDDDWKYHVNLDVKGGLLGESIKKQTSILSEEPEKHPDFDETIDNIPGRNIKSLLCVPIQVDDVMSGAIELINFDRRCFSITEQKILESFSITIASIFHNLHMIERRKVVDAELEATEWELSRSRNTLRSVFDNMPASVYIIDQEYKLVAANLARSIRAKKDPEDLIGLHCYVALYQRSTPCPGCLVGDTLFRKIVTHRKLRVKEANEETTEWDINSYPITNDTGQIIQALLIEQDITESRRLESILAQSEKMAAVGQLAAGLAHEINNPLTVVLANTQILQRELPTNEDWEESLDLIHRAGTRALQVVRNLLGVSRKEEYELAPIDVNENIQRALDLIRHEVVVRSVSLEFEKANSLPLIMASSDHLQGVWLNIVINALDAIEPHPGGIIKIATFQKDERVHVTISDNGSGITPDRLKRIFEPFYTTKEPGRGTGGTGLGLSVSYRIVKQHGGDIFVNSEIEEGTTFSVVLPTADQFLAQEENNLNID